jgi:beta-galactosidase
MYLGVDYYPEHQNIDMIDSDLKRIRDMGANTIRIGEFAWHLMESREGEYDFSFFDHVVKKAKEHNLKIIFGTPTATFPAWLCNQHPDILSEDIDGVKRSFGGRRQYCFNSQTYSEYSKKIITQLVNHYNNEEAIVAWQIDNELAHEESDICYCDNCHKAFLKFLKDKYHDIKKLNDTYGTIFWGQTYNSFDEIPLPKRTITFHNPSLLLDYARFRSYSINSYAKMQIDLVKKLKGEHQQVTHNFSGGFFGKLFDPNDMSDELDVVSYDNYPVWGGLREPMTPANIAMTNDYIRGLKNKNYWIMEELMGAQGHTIIGYLPRPNQAKMWSYQAVAHGCSNLLYFCWRSMNKGAEQYCFGILDHDNNVGRKYYEAQSFFKDIVKYEKVLNSPIKSDVAVLYSFDNIWSWRFQPQSTSFDFTNELLRLYTPFYKNNTHIDVISKEKDFSTYKIILVPVMQIIDETFAKRLEDFASRGGIVIFSYRTGIKDMSNNAYLGKVIPCNVKEMCGIEIREVESLQEGQKVKITGRGDYSGVSGTCSTWRDLIEAYSAEVLFNYDDKFYKDKACITFNKYKKGKVYYIGGGVDEKVLSLLIKKIILENNIDHIESEDGLEVYTRECDNIKYNFVINHTSEKKSYKGIILESYSSKIIKDI